MRLNTRMAVLLEAMRAYLVLGPHAALERECQDVLIARCKGCHETERRNGCATGRYAAVVLRRATAEMHSQESGCATGGGAVVALNLG